MDALQALLGAKPLNEITEEVPVKRLGTSFMIRALTEDDLDEVRRQATRMVRKGNKTEQELDTNEMARLAVAKGVISPDFTNAELLAKYGATDAGEVVKKALLPGEVIALQSAVLELSGFGDLDEEVAEVKN